jgi:hypothetical protein
MGLRGSRGWVTRSLRRWGIGLGKGDQDGDRQEGAVYGYVRLPDVPTALLRSSLVTGTGVPHRIASTFIWGGETDPSHQSTRYRNCRQVSTAPCERLSPGETNEYLLAPLGM